MNKNTLMIFTLVLTFGIGLFVIKEWNFVAKTVNHSDLFKNDCSKLAPKNPYLEKSGGEFAGFDWAMFDKGSRNCEAYNESFISGCMEYVRQEKDYNTCLGVSEDVQEVNPILLKNCSEKIDTEKGTYCLDGL